MRIFLITAACLTGCRDKGPQPPRRRHAAVASQSQRLASGLAVGGSTSVTDRNGSISRFPHFTDVHEAAGVQFRYDNGALGNALMVESTGGGAGWLDFDRDGQWDLYLVQGGNPAPAPGESLPKPSNRLFRNRGDGNFTDVSEFAQVSDTGYGQGIAIGDFDNDGFDDIYVTNVGRNVLYHNLGDGTFEDVTVRAALGNELWGTSAAWGDADLDGDLDLFLCNYLQYDPYHPLSCPKEDGSPGVCHPEDLDPQPNEFFVNQGNGRFCAAAGEWGLRGEGSKSLGVVIADFNDDPLPDIFVANDTTANFLFINQGDRMFRELATQSGCAVSGVGLNQAGMGVAFGDYDRNGFPDLYVTHFAQDSNTLYANLGAAGFFDTTRQTGLHQPTLKYLGFGTVMADFNFDGHEDLFVTNGHIDDWRHKGDLWQMPPQLFSFDTDRWQECSDQGGPIFGENRLGRGVASCDYDGDGDLDLAVVHQNAPMALLNNDSNCGHWLKLEFIGRSSNRRGVGVKVTLTQGNRRLVQQLAGGTSYCASHQPALFFGLDDSNQPCTISVRWPNGIRQLKRGVSVDQALVIREPSVALDSERH